MVVGDHDPYSGHEGLVARSRLAGRVSAPAQVAICAAVAVGCAAVAAALSTADQWGPAGLLAALVAATVLSELGSVRFPEISGSGSSLPLVLAMALLGPAPAVAIGMGSVTLESLWRRLGPVAVTGNAAAYGTFTLAGALLARAVLDDPPRDADPTALFFTVWLLAVFTDALNFALVAVPRALRGGPSVREGLRRAFRPALPYLVVSAALTAAAAYGYVTSGLGMLVALLVVLLVSVMLLRAISRAQERELQVARLALERSRLLGEALTAEERERMRLAAEIHDEALQLLAIAQQDLYVAEAGDAGALGTVRARVAEAVRAIRRTLAANVAVDARAVGLSASLRSLAERLCEGTGTAWTVEVEPEAAPADETLLYSLARELVTNAVKHARAAHLVVRVRPSGRGVRLEVVDDGVGFDPSVGAGSGHIGLALVAHRTRAAEGRLEIRSRPGDGTRVTLEVPAAAR